MTTVPYNLHLLGTTYMVWELLHRKHRLTVIFEVCLLLLPLLAHANHGALRINPFNRNPISTSGQATASWPAELREYLDHEMAEHVGERFAPYVASGGLHGTSSTLISPAFATVAHVPERVSQTSTAITYAASTNDVCWTIISSDNNGITGWTRVGSGSTGAYYYQCEGDTTPNIPALPANSAWLMQITVTNNAIVTVTDRRIPASYVKGGVINPTDPLYGARGDDIADDTIALRQAITAGGTLQIPNFIPPGTYRLTGKITLLNGTVIRCGGMLSTIIKNYANDDAFYSIYPQAQYITIEECQIFDGLGIALRTAGHAINFIGTGGFTQFYLNRLYVLGHTDGIHAVIAGYSTIANSRIVSSDQDGISLTGVSSNAVLLDSNYSLSHARYGYNLTDTNLVTINNNISDSNVSHGFYAERAQNTVFNATSAEANTGHGYYLFRSNYNTFNSARVSKAPTVDGIRLEGSQYTVINGFFASVMSGYCINAFDSVSPATYTVSVIINSAKFDTCSSGAFRDASTLGRQLYNGADASVIAINGLILGVTATSVNYSMTNSDFGVTATGSTGGISVALPVNPAVGRLAYVTKIDAGAGAVTVITDAGYTINGAASASLATQYSRITLIYSGSSNWTTLGGS